MHKGVQEKEAETKERLEAKQGSNRIMKVRFWGLSNTGGAEKVGESGMRKELMTEFEVLMS